jgi:hypothetical protein
MFVFLSWMAILAVFGYSLHYISCMTLCYACNELDNQFCSDCQMCPECCQCPDLNSDESDSDTELPIVTDCCSCHKRHPCRDDMDNDDDDDDDDDDANLPLISD